MGRARRRAVIASGGGKGEWSGRRRGTVVGMSKNVLTEGQQKSLRKVLAAVAVRDRTGEVGVLHGLDRFVSAQVILKGDERAYLNALAGTRGITIKRAK